MAGFAGWENFYVIAGSSAGALIGLQFVVMTLVTEKSGLIVEENAGAAFATPTIVHFSSVLLLSASLTAPWRGVAPIALLLGVFGLAGLGYGAVTIRRARKQTMYKPDFGDWLWHALLPLLAYFTLLFASVGFCVGLPDIAFAVGGAALLLLFIGIHNAWDTVSYHVFVNNSNSSLDKSSRSH